MKKAPRFVFRIHISNSQAFWFSRRRASWAFSLPPQNEGRRSAERRTVTTPRLISRIAGRQQHTATPPGAPPRRLLRPWDLTSGYSARAFARHPGRFPRPSPAPVQPLKAAPRSGHGRLPKAPRVRRGTSPPRPQAPHPIPRSKASYRNAPSCGIGCLGIYAWQARKSTKTLVNKT